MTGHFFGGWVGELVICSGFPSDDARLKVTRGNHGHSAVYGLKI